VIRLVEVAKGDHSTTFAVGQFFLRYIQCIYMASKAQLAQWGNSLAVRIPKPVAVAANLQRGDRLEFRVTGPGAIQILAAKPKPSLSQLLRGITSQNCHAQTDWGETVGHELL
jgi:antitoxin MazE